MRLTPQELGFGAGARPAQGMCLSVRDLPQRAGFKALILMSTLFALSIWVKRFKWAPIKSTSMLIATNDQRARFCTTRPRVTTRLSDRKRRDLAFRDRQARSSYVLCARAATTVQCWAYLRCASRVGVGTAGLHFHARNAALSCASLAACGPLGRLRAGLGRSDMAPTMTWAWLRRVRHYDISEGTTRAPESSTCGA